MDDSRDSLALCLLYGVPSCSVTSGGGANLHPHGGGEGGSEEWRKGGGAECPACELQGAAQEK
jgi:hypothetical protein